MKKVILSIIMLFSLILSFVSGLFVQKMINKKNTFNNKIDKIERICLDNSSSNSEMINCCDKAKKEWQKEISKYLNLLEEKTTKEQYQLIKDNNELWWNLYQSDEKIINEFIINHGGTLYYQLGISDETELIKNRAQFLKWIYDIHTDDILNTSN